MDLLTVGCIGAVVVVAAGVTVYINRKRRRAIEAIERRAHTRREQNKQPHKPVFDVKDSTVKPAGARVHDSGPRDIARKPTAEQIRAAGEARRHRERDRSDEEQRRRDDVFYQNQRMVDDAPAYTPPACSSRSSSSHSHSSYGCSGSSSSSDSSSSSSSDSGSSSSD